MIKIEKEKVTIKNNIIIPNDGIAVFIAKGVENTLIQSNIISMNYKAHKRLIFADTFWKKVKFAFDLVFIPRKS